MPLSNKLTTEIEEILKSSLRRKFESYKPEPAHMPFHTRLLGQDRMALFSFIHSLNTNFGTSIFEPVAKALGCSAFKSVDTHISVGKKISTGAQKAIQEIIDNLTTGESEPAKQNELAVIKRVCRTGEMVSVKPTVVDIWIEDFDDSLHLFDLKTAKPNKGGFKEFKRTLLEWAAVVLAENPNAKVNTYIAIPYNPYEPNPYERWTLKGMIDLKNELKVAEEFWDFLGKTSTFNQLLDCFERVGVNMRGEIDSYFEKYLK